MANLFKSIKPTAQLGRSSFDLSQKHVFSSKTGMGTPICPIETVPDDHFKINVASLHRTMTMNTAAFLRGKFRYDTYFVPYSQLWHNFNQFIDQRKDKHSSALNDFKFCPVFSIGELLKFALQSFRKFHWNVANVFALDCDLYGAPFIFGCVRVLDLLGYGNYEPILIPTLSYNPATGQPWSGTERDDAFNDAYSYCYQFDSRYVNLFRIAAYNHVWYDIYRNKYYDEVFKPFGSSIELDYIELFNFDDLSCNTFTNSTLIVPPLTYSAPDSAWDTKNALRVFGIFNTKYVQWKKDLFTSSMPGTQFGSVSTVDLSGINITSNAVPNSSSPGYSNPRVYSNGSEFGSLEIPNASNSTSWSINSSFDVLALKRSEALQAWKQNTLRAGNMVDSNFRAHYGVEPRYEADNNVLFLGSFEAILDVNSVVANADTGGSTNGNVGDIAATGSAVLKGQEINFDCNDFGVILTISSFVPESEYAANMIDRANRLSEPFDFFTPEYQNIGLESVAGVDLDVNLFSNEPNKVLGFAPRYFMYKTAMDKVHGEFARVAYMVPNQPIEEIDGSLRAWVAPRREFLVYSGFDSDGFHIKNRALPTFYCSPYALDNVFGLNTINDLNGIGRQNTDCFLNNVFFDIKAVRPMSVLGLPQF